MKNKKAQFLTIGAVVLILIVVGGFIFFTQQAKAAPLTKEQINAILAEEEKTQPISPPSTPPEVLTQDSVTPPPPDPEIIKDCSVTGEWEQLYVKEKTSSTGFGGQDKAIGIFRYTGDCTTDIYLEAGIVPGTKLALAAMPNIAGAIPTTPSWCDANRNYYGHLWKDVRPNQQLRVLFKPESPSEAGQYKMTIGAYTGCLSDKTTAKPIRTGGQIITDNSFTIRVSDSLYKTGISESIEAQQSWARKI